MNEFEKDAQSKSNDFVDAANGFIFSFGFFTLIFLIGVIMSAVTK